ncbi:hypothetical protein GW17_00005246 [Ensete ventricosum]|nr:hypothetical protein GW17_00005246 [Ensete ventricosum]
MAPRFEEQGQLQLLEREEDEEEDCFESIDKRKYLSARRLAFIFFDHKYASEFRFCLIHGIAVVIAQGINAGDIKKLQDAGIYTCNGLMMHTKKVCSPVRASFDLSQSLTGIKGLSEAKVDKICEAAEKLVVRSSHPSIQHFFNLCNLWRSSDTFDLCFVPLPSRSQNMGYVTGSDLLLRVRSVTNYRIVPIAERFGMDAGAVLDNIVDSVIALFRVDFCGRGELAERQLNLDQGDHVFQITPGGITDVKD